MTILYADAPNQDFDVASVGAVTILSKSIISIVARDQVLIDIFCTIMNNSGSARTYTPVFNLGTFSAGSAEATTTAASATNRRPMMLSTNFAVSSSILSYAGVSVISSVSGATNTALALSTSLSGQLWTSTTSDITGTQTFTFTVASSAATATQTLTLHSYLIQKIPQA